MMLGGLTLVLLAFINIFTNVWGYVEPISPFFRNKYWLPFALIAGFLTILSIFQRKNAPVKELSQQRSMGWELLLVGIALITAIAALRTDRVTHSSDHPTSLVVMTYNIQQANDNVGEKSYQRQLALIQQVDPDILALQESDSARISLNNNDYVRYFASKLGYHTYYGPTTVSGTYGTAILSKFPLQNPRSVFSYSDQDEVGTAVAEIEINGQRFTIYSVHPAGSDTAMLSFAETLLARSMGQSNVIALGDYNLRENEVAYQMIDQVFTNAWISVYPDGISDEGLDMSGTKRIDHIFISPHLGVRNPVYLLAPDSATDHPAHWAEIYWDE
jgi:endonuclease/exonuclease/phosphatase family metal-dependent hydrolase